MKHWTELGSAFYLACGLAIVGIGIGMHGVAGCEARSTESRNRALTEMAPFAVEADRRQAEAKELRWQLENGVMTREEYVSKRNGDPIDTPMKKFSGTTLVPTTRPSQQ